MTKLDKKMNKEDVCPICGSPFLEPNCDDEVCWAGQNAVKSEIVCADCGCVFERIYKTQYVETHILEQQ